MPSYVQALVNEIELWGRTLSHLKGKDPTIRQLDTIFFGGGTPSYIPPENIQQLLETVHSNFPVAPNAEITLEANPGDIKSPQLKSWMGAGVNRLSIGMQSLDDSLLHVLGRRHTSAMARAAYYEARNAGFDNLNLDLMYGLPYQTLDQWENTLKETLTLQPEHLSLYCLTLEEGTPLATWVQQEKLPDPDPDLAADMYLLAEKLMGLSGYKHYEISNWALPGKSCKHNLTYWYNQPYLGVGPGAHSYLGNHRLGNLNSPREYMKRVKRWSEHEHSFEELVTINNAGTLGMVETIDLRLEMAETMLLGLRLCEGVSENAFKKRFGMEIREVYTTQIPDLEALGLIDSLSANYLRLTPKGRLLGNEVFQRFLEH